MKLLVLPLLLLAAAAAAAAAADPYTADINNRKLKLMVVRGDFMHPDPERESRRVQHQLLENPAGAKNAAINNGGAFAYDAAKAGESVDSNVDQATDPTTAGRSGNKQINDYPGSGAGLDSHHTIDLQIWNKQHPPKPSN